MWKYLAVLGCVLYAVNVHSAPQGTPNEVQQPVKWKGLSFKKQIILIKSDGG